MNQVKTKISAIISALLLMCSGLFAFTGTGTTDDPYLIASTADLAQLASDVNGETSVSYENSFFKLTANLDLAAYPNWEPIGNSSLAAFRGNFNGDNHFISNLTITGSGNYRALFGSVKNGAQISNLNLKNCTISGGNFVGGLIGLAFLEAENSSIMITNCTTSGIISGVNKIGGLIGAADMSTEPAVDANTITVANSSSIAKVSASADEASAGGLIGFSGRPNAGNKVIIKYCFATGSVTNSGAGSFAGGLIGYSNYSAINDCYASGSVQSVNTESKTGGLIGGNNNSNLDRCYSVGAVNGSGSFVGGLIGFNSGSAVNYCYWNTETSGQANSAGGTAKTTADLKKRATYSNYPSNWEFTTSPKIWRIREDLAYPVLFNQYLFGSYSVGNGKDYSTIADAIDAFNNIGAAADGVVSGGVTFNIEAGHTETFTYPNQGLITASGTLTNPVVFSKATEGKLNTNPLITAAVGTGTTDGIIKIGGADYLSFTGIDLQENSLNTDATTQMEWGYAIVKVIAVVNYSNVTDGAQNINITNCAVTLNKTNVSTIGIYGANHLAASTSQLNVSGYSGMNANLKINGCTVSNCYIPFYFKGNNMYANYDPGLEIGTTSGNTIFNYGGSTAATPSTYGIYITSQNAAKIENNTITLTGSGPTEKAYGIYVDNNKGNLDVNNNTISVTSNAPAMELSAIYNRSSISPILNINNNKILNCNYAAATTGSFYAIRESGNTDNCAVSINGNLINGLVYGSLEQPGSGLVYGIYATPYTACTALSVTASNNTIRNFNLYGNANANPNGSVGGQFYGIAMTKGNSQTTQNDSIYNNSINGTGIAGCIYGISHNKGDIVSTNNVIFSNSNNKLTGTGEVCGIKSEASTTTENYSGNLIYNLTHAGYGTGVVYGVYGILTKGSATKTISGNTIHSLTSNGGAAHGIYNTLGSLNNIYRNNIYNLTSTGASVSAGTVSGIYINSGTTSNIYNNFISDLKSPKGSYDAISGLYLYGGTNINAYFNTIYLNATSSHANFGTNGIFAFTAPIVDLRNNIVVNTSTPGTSTYGAAAAYTRRYDTSLGNYAATSNNNSFYAGIPGTKRLIYYNSDTVKKQTIDAFKTLVGPTRDNASITENVAFINSSTTPYDLHINATTPTSLESGGTPVTTPFIIDSDFDGNTRNETPDIGADEGSFIAIASDIAEQMAKVTTLANNYPNPFNPSTLISFTLANNSLTKLSVYNTKGEVVKTLVNSMQSAGSHKVNFDGTGFNSGVYFYKLEADGKSIVKRMIMVK